MPWTFFDLDLSLQHKMEYLWVNAAICNGNVYEPVPEPFFMVLALSQELESKVISGTSSRRKATQNNRILKSLFEILIKKYSKIVQIETHMQCKFYRGRRKNAGFSKSFKKIKLM